MEQELHEECGVFGVYGQAESSELTYHGLHSLQHRGQEGAGIATADGETVRCRKGDGLLTEAVSADDLRELTGSNSIGHVRYSTAGGNERENIQPMLARAFMGTLAVAHNGQIVNADQLRRELESQGSIFSGSSDSEIILHLIQKEKGPLLEKIQNNIPEDAETEKVHYYKKLFVFDPALRYLFQICQEACILLRKALLV